MADSLFSPELISPSVTADLPDGYSMRPLQRSDYSAGFLDVLRVLTTVGDVKQEEFEKRFDEMKSGQGYHVLVIINGQQQIVGTGALIVERKLCVLWYPWMILLILHAAFIPWVLSVTSRILLSPRISKARSWD